MAHGASQTARRARSPRRPSSTQRAVVTGIVAVVLGLAALLAVSVLSSRGDVDIRLGDDRFSVGRTERLAERIALDRRPFLFSDVSGRQSRDLYIQHLGDDPAAGWLAFAARAPGQDDRACALVWDVADQELVDPCTAARFPADGTGLTRYPVEVTDGLLFVDLRSAHQPVAEPADGPAAEP